MKAFLNIHIIFFNYWWEKCLLCFFSMITWKESTIKLSFKESFQHRMCSYFQEYAMDTFNLYA